MCNGHPKLNVIAWHWVLPTSAIWLRQQKKFPFLVPGYSWIAYIFIKVNFCCTGRFKTFVDPINEGQCFLVELGVIFDREREANATGFSSLFGGTCDMTAPSLYCEKHPQPTAESLWHHSVSELWRLSGFVLPYPLLGSIQQVISTLSFVEQIVQRLDNSG